LERADSRWWRAAARVHRRRPIPCICDVRLSNPQTTRSNIIRVVTNSFHLNETRVVDPVREKKRIVPSWILIRQTVVLELILISYNNCLADRLALYNFSFFWLFNQKQSKNRLQPHLCPLNFADGIDEKRSSCLRNKIRNLTK
jgi:hypothetical protein